MSERPKRTTPVRIAGAGETPATEFLLYQTEDGQTRVEVRID